MKRFLFYVFVFVFSTSCTKYPNVEFTPHTKLLGLKGKVRQVHYSCNEYKITETDYKDGGKSTISQKGLFGFSDGLFLPTYNLLFNEFNRYTISDWKGLLNVKSNGIPV